MRSRQGARRRKCREDQDFLLRHRRLAGGIAVDTSALMAIVLGEAEGDGCIAGVDFSKTDLESAL